MSKFKIGDEVVCTYQGDDYWYKAGDRLIVSSEGFADPDAKELAYNIEGEGKSVWIDGFDFQLCLRKTEAAEYDVVTKPWHYQLTDSLEVKDLMKILLDRIEQSDIGFSHFQSSCYKEAMQYLLRFMLKNGYEDLAKAQVYLNEVMANRKEIK